MAKSDYKRPNPVPPSARVYFPGRDKSVLKQVEKMSNKYGLTVSKICVLALRLGLPLVEKNLKGLLFDVGFQAEVNSKGDGVFTESPDIQS